MLGPNPVVFRNFARTQSAHRERARKVIYPTLPQYPLTPTVLSLTKLLYSVILDTGSLTMKKIVMTKQNVPSQRNVLPTDTTTETTVQSQSVKIESGATETETNATSTYLQEPPKDLLPQEANVLTGVNMDGDTVVYDGNNFISYEVSAVEEINEYSVEDSWQTENVVMFLTILILFNKTLRNSDS